MTEETGVQSSLNEDDIETVFTAGNRRSKEN